jgi:hypothetical protein
VFPNQGLASIWLHLKIQREVVKETEPVISVMKKEGQHEIITFTKKRVIRQITSAFFS